MRLSSRTLLMWAGLACTTPTPLASGAQASANDSGAPQSAREHGHDIFAVFGEWDHLSTQSEGGRGSIDWLHYTARERTLNLGMSTYAMGGSQWTVGRAGVSFRLGGRWSFDSQLNLGGGHTTGSTFLYQHYQGRFTYHVSSRVYIKAREEFFDIGDSRGHLLGTGIYLIPFHLISADLAYAHSVGGNLGTEFVSGRFEFDRQTLRPFAGFAAGQAGPEVLGLGVGQNAGARDLREGFLGAVFPLSPAELSVAMDWTQVGNTRRGTLMAGLKFPIRKNPRIRSKP